MGKLTLNDELMCEIITVRGVILECGCWTELCGHSIIKEQCVCVFLVQLGL